MERIVVVDDDLSLCHFLKKTLSQKGYQVVTCHNGKEALGITYEQEADLILLDNKLPDRNVSSKMRHFLKEFIVAPYHSS